MWCMQNLLMGLFRLNRAFSMHKLATLSVLLLLVSALMQNSGLKRNLVQEKAEDQAAKAAAKVQALLFRNINTHYSII